jgi:hypothetical protein
MAPTQIRRPLGSEAAGTPGQAAQCQYDFDGGLHGVSVGYKHERHDLFQLRELRGVEIVGEGNRTGAAGVAAGGLAASAGAVAPLSASRTFRRR